VKNRTESRPDRDSLKRLGNRIERSVKEAVDKIEGVLKKDLLEKKAKPSDKDRGPLFYLETFLRDKNVATVSPSSKYVIGKVLKGLDLHGVRTVVEYGPADGVMTRRILQALPQDGILTAIERNADFYNALVRLPDPRLRPVHGDVRQAERVVHGLGLQGVDRVVSGIPFSFLSLEERHSLLAQTARLLNPGGRFVAYQFTTHLIPLLKRYFKVADISFEIRNLPPHFVFTCVKR